ncbi:two-component system chemotaxis sensor kinase CheA [Jatrophihabitans sp. GAS493]|uniref:chemotaxis protein CheW n=1 Tax=Jatrophihabitans sp. GAS493 TaxID=1907575 RepID=UPI000BB94D12|nr:chemotaxis protein CheW [Jatrophihabitans sp. GAS493]SOD74515.1 two-component system chemotaxis sensor kinase CheA [Jatrophihabitans sp. GAS493]
MSSNEDLDLEIVQEFLIESHENLDQLDRDLVSLEQTPDSRELLASIFRTIHTIKGTSGFLAYHRLEAVTHAGESLLAKLRDGAFRMTPDTADALLRMVDAVRAILVNIEQQHNEGDADVTPLVEELRALLESKLAEAAAGEAAPSVDADAEVEAVVDATAEPVAADAAPAAGPSGLEILKPKAPAKPRAPRASTAKAAPKAAPAKAAPAKAIAAKTAAVTPVETAVVEPVTAKPAAAKAPAKAAAAKANPNAAAPAEADGRPGIGDSTIRVDVTLLEQLMRLVGELVLARNQIVQRASTIEDDELGRACHRLNLVAGELQEGVMRTRMQPIDHVWSKLPRVVRDLSSQLGRTVRLEMEGGDTELDRTLLEAVKDPLTHLVRNAIDHGIEDPETRRVAGKDTTGVLTLRAAHEGGQILVEIKDDGKGLDPEVLGRKAVEKGIVTQAQLDSMGPNDILQLVFVPGFSTASAVTNVSGRGVGMDVVRTNIERIGGSIDVDSTVGVGTAWRLRIPLTLAIVPALTVECAGQRFAIPQVNLLELVSLDERSSAGVENMAGAEVYRLRGSLLPLVRLDEALKLKRATDEEVGTLVVAVLEADDRRFGLVVDRVLDTEEIVVKPLSSALKELGLYAGATILGDGAVSLILDVQSLARRRLRAVDSHESAQSQRSRGAGAGSSERQLLVVALGGDRRVAVPLDVVTRLEQFPADSIERVGRRDVVRYRGAIMPLVRLSEHLGSGFNDDRETIPGVVYSAHGRSVALAVGEIVDIVAESSVVHSDVEDIGLIGSAVIRDRVTEMLDVRAAILAADPMFFAEDATSGAAFTGEYFADQEQFSGENYDLIGAN